jgi:hypothetical protein
LGIGAYPGETCRGKSKRDEQFHGSHCWNVHLLRPPTRLDLGQRNRDFHFASRLQSSVSPFASLAIFLASVSIPKPRACPAGPLPGQKAMICPIPQRFLGLARQGYYRK